MEWKSSDAPSASESNLRRASLRSSYSAGKRPAWGVRRAPFRWVPGWTADESDQRSAARRWWGTTHVVGGRVAGL